MSDTAIPAPTVADLTARIRPRRAIHGISAVFCPFTADGEPDLDALASLIAGTAAAGLEPAVNMDTGFGPQLAPATRAAIVRLTRDVLGPDTPFVAGAMPFGHDGDPIEAYRAEATAIAGAGGTPVVFPSAAMGDDVVGAYRRIVAGLPRALGFELGAMFAPFGRIFDADTFAALLDVPELAGAKHSSLDRATELRRLEARDRLRPDFRVYTGNDLAIDMVMYGSDYLLGLSAFDPDAFALRDRWWAEGDLRFFALNDALQALGAVVFRDPVPAYKHDAACYLGLSGRLPGARPHPDCERRPAWEPEILEPLMHAIRAAAAR